MFFIQKSNCSMLSSTNHLELILYLWVKGGGQDTFFLYRFAMSPTSFLEKRMLSPLKFTFEISSRLKPQQGNQSLLTHKISDRCAQNSAWGVLGMESPRPSLRFGFTVGDSPAWGSGPCSKAWCCTQTNSELIRLHLSSH